MGKSINNSTPTVKSTPAVAASTEHTEKGKREAEEVIEKQASAKKHRKDATIEEAVEKKINKNAEITSSHNTTSSFHSGEDHKEPAAKIVVLPKKQPVAAAKKGTLNDELSSSLYDPESSEENDYDKEAFWPVAAVKNGPVVDSKKAVSRDGSDSSSDDKSSSSDDQVPITKVILSKRSSLVSSPKQKKPDNEEASENQGSPECDDEKPPMEKTKVLPNAAIDAVKPGGKDAQNEGSNDEESSDDLPSKAHSTKKETDVNMADASLVKMQAKQTQTPCSLHAEASKTVFVGNLSFSVEQADVENFFKEAGEIVEIRFASDREGVFKGYGHVEFANADAAQKAVELNGQELLGRYLKIDLARKRGTPYSSWDNSFHTRGKFQEKRIFIRGFDKKDGEDEIRTALEEHFRFCGQISNVSIPKDGDGVRGIAYIDFTDTDGFSKALKLHGSELGASTLTVEAARRRGDNRGNASSGRGGGRFGGRRGGGWGFGGGGGGCGRPSKPSIHIPGTGRKTTFGDDD